MWRVSVALRGVEALTKSEVNRATRRALESMGRRWREKYLAKRFTKAGAREYGFRPRQGENNPRKRGTYTNRKLRLFGHTLPLVFTGELRQQALYEIKTVRATATSTRGANVRIKLPKKANFHLKEMRAVSAAEIADLQQFLAGALNLELQRAGARHTSARVTIGAGGGGAAAAA